MFYYLYKITNLVNGKIYVGVHKAKSMDDGYMGSGKVIKSAIEKYGLENFRKDILETFENAEAMYAREKEVVNDEFLLREDVYNLRRGGNGGFDYINSQGKNVTFKKQWELDPTLHRRSIERALARQRELMTDPEYRANYSKIRSEAHKGLQTFLGKSHTLDSRAKISAAMQIAQAGEKNSQFGTCWINNGIDAKKIKKEEIQHWLDLGWSKGRKLSGLDIR